MSQNKITIGKKNCDGEIWFECKKCHEIFGVTLSWLVYSDTTKCKCGLVYKIEFGPRGGEMIPYGIIPEISHEEKSEMTVQFLQLWRLWYDQKTEIKKNEKACNIFLQDLEKLTVIDSMESQLQRLKEMVKKAILE